MVFKLAWRNLWRNKRRTAITLMMMVFAVFLAALMASVRTGMVQGMVNNVISTKVGHAQIHAKGFWEEKSIDNVLILSDSITDVLDNRQGVEAYALRIESGALCASDSNTVGVIVFGVDIENEKRVSTLLDKLSPSEQESLKNGGVLVGKSLLKQLQVLQGEELSFAGMGYHGSMAMGNFDVISGFDFGNPALNKRLVIMSLDQAESFYGIADAATSVLIKLGEDESVDEICASLKQELPGSTEIFSWKEMLPDMEQMLVLNDVGNMIVSFILYFIISFGFFGTVVMMMAERKHELGVLTAIGMKKKLITQMVVLESVLVALIGAIIGIILVSPVIYYLYLHPIPLMEDMAELMDDYGIEPMIYTAFSWNILYMQAVIVTIISLLISIYPMVKVAKLHPIKAMRS